MPSTNGIIRAADDPPKVTPISSATARSDRAGFGVVMHWSPPALRPENYFQRSGGNLDLSQSAPRSLWVQAV